MKKSLRFCVLLTFAAALLTVSVFADTLIRRNPPHMQRWVSSYHFSTIQICSGLNRNVYFISLLKLDLPVVIAITVYFFLPLNPTLLKSVTPKPSAHIDIASYSCR